MKKSSGIILELLILAMMRANGQNGEKSSQPADASYDLESPLRGDNRIVFGLMVALCNHCGLD